MENFKIGCSPITATIYAGKVNKNGMWASGKKDVTETAPMAVAEHLLIKGEAVQFTYRGVEYVLKVEPLVKSI